jgi:chaperone required for assembly of F1-ATPase
MRDIFAEIFENQPLDPMVSARQGGRPNLRKRFYRHAHIGEGAGEGGFAVLLDGKPIMTPARRALAAPTPALAKYLAAEWDAQAEVIEPGRMPLTRLANAVIDAVADQAAPVAEEVAKYLGSDLLFYRADAPPGLVALQSRHWDPVLDWAHEKLGARFILVEGVVFSAQPDGAIAAARKVIPDDPWKLGAVASVTTLTGSGLLALALSAGQLDVNAAWTAAHVDEDWQMAHWGRDEAAIVRRDYRFAEMQAAGLVLRHAA